MANASTTQASSASQTTGSPIPLSYGYVWVTGKRHAYYTIQDTGNSHMDYTRVGIWLLGHGEWDGCSELWINDLLAWTNNASGTAPDGFSGQTWLTGLDYPNQPFVFNFHSGCDSVIGSGLTPSSSGPDQGCDVLWGQFPSAIQPLCFSRIAYYTLMRKQPLLYQTNDHQNDPSQWTDINPVGLWRALRCRLFDANGNVTGYAFTTNPAWHWVDVWLRRKLFPDYNLGVTSGPDPLPSAVSACFDWESIYEAAQYFDGFLANGRRRFTGSYSFSAQTSLQACLSQILLCCRSYQQSSQGKLSLVCDMPRPSVFIFSREHVLPGTFEATDQALHTAGNRYVGTFRDVLVPAAATIASITAANQANPEVTTEAPHPFNAADRIAIGGTGTVYDGTWSVATVPAVMNAGTPEEVDPTTFTIVRKGANYPASVGSGGAVGLLYSRFKERSPEFWHKTNMLARGAVGLNVARLRNKVKQGLDFATSTYDQVSRISRYERDRALGFDQTPYVTPAKIKLRTSMFAKDVNGQLACGLQPGDHVTVDNTLSWPYAGDYEVLDPLTIHPPSTEAFSSDGSLSLSPAQDSGEIEFTLGTYNECYMYDTSDNLDAGWPSVPGSDPGNDTAFTSVPLANGGNFAFFTGQLASGSQFQLPSTGYPPANMLAWASPAGSNINYHSADCVELCSVSAARTLTLIYADDEGNTWGGDLNYAALTWLSTDVTFTDSTGMTWIEFTLLGGETILFGHGVLANGATIELPAGFTNAQAFANAYLHDMQLGGHIMYLAGAWVDSSMGVHCQCQDHSGNVWTGNASVLVFAYRNNMGTVTSSTSGSATWLSFPLSNGEIFGVGCAKNMADSSTLVLPSNAGGGSTLEPMVGPSDEMYTAPGGHAQGIGTCYLDQNDVVHCTFNNGAGTTWTSTADIFATYCVAGTAEPTLVEITTPAVTLARGAAQAFAAKVTGNANTAVTWSVDGIAGGNTLVGTIDANGNYVAGSEAGTHTITATSVANGAVISTATVVVFGAGGMLNVNGS
jgi:hypothetical protein